ncbi:hypothetical protein BCV70DRAFT_201181 [Testicularia cyperi]|uniref:Diphthine--ammonia ligase n=1 Tax=Testicularia cyperi TaxID=1882483 RepID=A0A317XKW4_9BASI|nr:hypothetical protein BCV70DRAFT_201181 [Testicularia cyperi]
MKVVGLLSGGKDSCYNLLHCVQQGHEIVALATLAPPESTDELDSYMYQTVGHDAVHLVAQAMEIPLYRRTIKGTALNQGAEYGNRQPEGGDSGASSSAPDEDIQARESGVTDETEDLYHLLHDVKQHHPDVEAVSVGAILSNYQRVRVEHVCLRTSLNLLPLTFLWQRNQLQLLREMVSSGLESILIKVAGIGLTQTHLGKTLGQMQPKLEQLNRLYGSHVCGEGGEYETLTLDSPLFKKRIRIMETETVVHSDSAFGSVSYLRILKAGLEDKQVDASAVREWKVPIPNTLDSIGFKTLKAAQRTQSDVHDTDLASLAITPEPLGLPVQSRSKATVRKRGRFITVSNVTGNPTPRDTTTSDTSTRSLEAEVVSAFSQIQHLLAKEGVEMTSIAHINLYLSSQSLFPAINAVYRRHFGISPPTRACVALPRISDWATPDSSSGASSSSSTQSPRFTVSVIAFNDTNNGLGQTLGEPRRALHVQGRSYWAPANIGPYSQAVVVAERIWIAGQIGLIPSTLELENDGAMQAALALQHARRIVQAVLGDMGGRDVQKAWVEGGVCWSHTDAIGVAHQAWLAQVSQQDQDQDQDDEDGDGDADADADDDDDDDKGPTQSWLGAHVNSPHQLPPLLFASLPTGCLPRGAAVEWQLTSHTGRVASSAVAEDVLNVKARAVQDADNARDEDDDDEEEEEDQLGSDATAPEVLRVAIGTDGGHINQEEEEGIVNHSLTSRQGRSSFGVLSFPRPITSPVAQSQHPELQEALSSIQTRAFSVSLFYTHSCDPHEVLAALQLPDASLVPVSSLHILASDTMSLTRRAFALVWHGV